MKKTPFAGLTILEPGEGLDTDNGAFIDQDRSVIDRLLQLGVKLHRHTGRAGLSNPAVAPSAAIVASAGHIPPELTITIGYTLQDAEEGETQISPLSTVSTGTAMSPPPAAPSGKIDYTAGSLLTNTYYYATTFIDKDGGETPAGPAVGVERAPGFASGRAMLSNLTYGMSALGAVGWRLYRAVGGGSYDLLTSGNTGQDTFIDDGTIGVNCDVHPPTDAQNTTKRTNTLTVKLPTADANMASASLINVYGTITGSFGQAAFLGAYPLASAGNTIVYTDLDFNDAMPPDVNLSVGTARQIDPDTELLDWHWRRPVAASAFLGSGTLGDVKLAEDSGALYAVLLPSAGAIGPTEWVRIGSGAAGAGPPGPPGPPGSAASGFFASAVPGGSAFSDMTFMASAHIDINLKALTPPSRGMLTFTVPWERTPSIPCHICTEATLPAYTRNVNTLTANANGALPQIDGVFPLPGYYLLVKNGTGADRGVYKILSVGSSTEKWRMERVPEMSRSEQLAQGMTFRIEFGTKNQFRTLTLTTSGLMTLNTTALSFAQDTKDHGLQGSGLPEAARCVEGDTCTLMVDQEAGIFWQFIFKTGTEKETEYPWKKIGGPPLRAEFNTGIETKATTYQTTNAPSVTFPRTGDYRVAFGCEDIRGTTGEDTGYCRVGYHQNGVLQFDTLFRADSAGASTAHRVVVDKDCTLSQAAQARYKKDVEAGGAVTFEGLFIEIDPIRLK